MAYDEALADRIRSAIGDRPGVTERKMFGGLCFMAGGNMFCGIVKDDLMARVGAEQHAEALSQPGARPMDFSGRPMVGMVYVAPPFIDDDATLSSWVARSYEFASSLPAKGEAAPKKRSRTK
jgi:TfoX/Sxy family transcriptional regulator of competence genes